MQQLQWMMSRQMLQQMQEPQAQQPLNTNQQLVWQNI